MSGAVLILYAGLSAATQAQAADEHIPSLFSSLPTKAAADTDTGVVRDRQVTRWRPVDIDLSLLTAEADVPGGTKSGGQTIALNLFDNVNFVAVADRVERGPRGVTWTGHLRGVDMSNVVLVINDKVVSGNISMPMARYHIRFAGNGTHEVQRIDQSKFPRDEPYVPIPDLGANGKAAAGDAPNPGTQADDGSTIDVMVVYTATARAAAGGTNAMKSLIDLAVAETNQSYQNSGVTQRLRLVHAAEVAYAETGSLEDALNCITKTTDGCIDNVHTLRNTYGADVVSFWLEDGGGSCGLGYHMDTVSASFAPYAFSAVARSCATGYYSFGHELGHNMGLMHDVYMDNSVKPYAYAHGYVSTSGGWRTIMAYNNACSAIGKDCDRLQYWANPSVSYKGTAMGNSTTADDHKALNNTASVVANFRTSVVSGGGSATVVEFYNTNLDNYFITADAGEASAIDNGSAGPGWSRTGGSFKSGGSTSVCRFYGSLSPGPNSHFYTVNASECANLKSLQATTPDTQKRWNFESLDFISTPPVNNACASGTVPVYRAYNNGFTRGVDSNHRITTSLSAIQEVVNRGWSNEGIVMCAPS